MEHVLSFILVIVWACITYLLPVPGCPTGYLGAGGISEDGTNYKCIGGAAGYIDSKFFGSNHIYNYPTPIETGVFYPGDESVPYDPEGILGTLTSIFMVYLGLQAGKWFNFYDSDKTRLKYLIGACVIGKVRLMTLTVYSFEVIYNEIHYMHSIQSK